MFRRILLGFLIVLGLPEFALANCDGTGPCYCYGAVCSNTPPPNNSNSNSSGDSDDDDGGAAVRRAQAAEVMRRAEEQRRREAELEQQRINAENKQRMEEMAKQAKFIDDRNAAASTLRGSTGATSGGSTGSILRGSTGNDANAGPALRGSGIDTGLHGLRSNTVRESNLDPMVVDARKVSSGLPKSVDDAIASGYSGAPSGVSDRVRKGFQAIATHDWKVARAWFQDALNRDPNNAGLNRLVELADYTEKHIRQGNAGKPHPSSSHRTSVQMPEDSDIQYLFPGWQPAQTNPSSAAAGASTPIRHDDPTLELLFPGLPAIEAKELNDYMFDQAIKMTANDPLLIKVSNRPGYKKSKIPVN